MIFVFFANATESDPKAVVIATLTDFSPEIANQKF